MMLGTDVVQPEELVYSVNSRKARSLDSGARRLTISGTCRNDQSREIVGVGRGGPPYVGFDAKWPNPTRNDAYARPLSSNRATSDSAISHPFNGKGTRQVSKLAQLELPTAVTHSATPSGSPVTSRPAGPTATPKFDDPHGSSFK